MRQVELTILQRIIAVLLYIVIICAICLYFSGNWDYLTSADSKYNLLFISCALLLIFGTYITEPYFTKPIDVITNATAIILALLSVNNPTEFVGYWYLFYSAVGLGFISIMLIFLSQIPKLVVVQRTIYEIVTKMGQSRVIFSTIYILTIISYFRNEPIEFTALLTFWVVFISKIAVENIVLWFSKVVSFVKLRNKQSMILGEAIGCENPFLYEVEIDYHRHKVIEANKGDLVYLSLDDSKGAIGIIINEKHLLNKKWITIYLLEEDNAPLRIDLRKHEFICGTKNIYSKDNAVFILNIDNIADNDSKMLVEENNLYKNRNYFIGYIAAGSDINKIRFHSLIDNTNEKYKSLKEGTVIKTKIHDTDVLYQIIDGHTDEEQLEKHDIYGYLTGIAHKLGRYNASKEELEVVKWLPDIFAPVFFDNENIEYSNPTAIGRLPETDFQIILKDPNALVTHNTAILGILGIGKSCLTYELIKKLVDHTKVKIICIDITNEYKKELIDYINSGLIISDNENVFKELNTKYPHIHYDLDKWNKPTIANHAKSGNKSDYIATLDNDLKQYFFNQENIPDNKQFTNRKRIRIYNPDYHKVSKGEKVGFNVITTDLTQAEKTRIISERIFKILMDVGIKENQDARVVVIFEEAHSLVPEWNSTANEGDKTAVNGTAKVILQGRKYGLGSIVVTQRTANISKSILNQCNTIFALRVFDDTGKQFLENYIGSDYANILPTLEERHAIVVGKALKLKQPVIVTLNHMDDIRNSNTRNTPT